MKRAETLSISIDEIPWDEVVDNLHDGAAIVDSSGTFIFANDTFTRLSGFRTLEGLNVEIMLPDDVVSQHGTYIKGWFANPHAKIMSHGSERILKFKRFSGELIQCEIALAPIYIKDNVYSIVSLRDATTDIGRQDLIKNLENTKAQLETANEEAENKVSAYEKREKAEGQKKAVLFILAIIGAVCVIPFCITLIHPENEDALVAGKELAILALGLLGGALSSYFGIAKATNSDEK